MRSTTILREEHDAVLIVLDQLEQAVAAAEQGIPVPKDIFADIKEFFTVFVDQCHHGKEEKAVFHQLDSSDRDRNLARMLAEEHQTGRELAAAFATAVSEYVPGDVGSATRLAAAAGAYDVMLRQHIDEENNDLFPAMEQSLGDVDAQMIAEFDRIEFEELGAGTHERLHEMIDTLPGRITSSISKEHPRA